MSDAGRAVNLLPPMEKCRKRRHGSEPVMLEEVIIEILSWLHVKPLLRFRCVCKSWKSLMSDPCFIKLHLHRSPKIDNLILKLDKMILSSPHPHISSSIMILPLNYFLQNPVSTINAAYAQYDASNCNTEYKYNVLGSCNGLVCLLHYAYKYCWVLFWNPAMGLCSKKSPSVSADRSTKFGFGYDKSTDTYKVVAVLNDIFIKEESKRTQVKVYTMGDRDYSWRDIERFPAFPLTMQSEGKFLGGTLNWVAIQNFVTGPIKTIKWDIPIDQFVIVSLDLGSETYKQFSLPPLGLDEIPDPGNFEPRIEVFWDSICLCYDYKDTHFAMWQMKEFGVEKSWTQFVKVSYQHLQIGGGPLLPLCISDNSDVLMLVRNGYEIILYNRRNNRVEGAAKTTSDRLYMDAKYYVQSLILPCCN